MWIIGICKRCFQFIQRARIENSLKPRMSWHIEFREHEYVKFPSSLSRWPKPFDFSLNVRFSIWPCSFNFFLFCSGGRGRRRRWYFLRPLSSKGESCPDQDSDYDYNRENVCDLKTRRFSCRTAAGAARHCRRRLRSRAGPRGV
jgi:hypothetical protein